MALALNDFSEVLEQLKGPGAGGGGNGAEKRRSVRTEVQARVVVAPVIHGRVGTAFTDLTSDISATGMGLVQSIPMAREQHLLVRLPRKSRKPLYILCWVMHCRPLAHGLFALGVEFHEYMNMSEEDFVVGEVGPAGESNPSVPDADSVEEFVLA